MKPKFVLQKNGHELFRARKGGPELASKVGHVRVSVCALHGNSLARAWLLVSTQPFVENPEFDFASVEDAKKVLSALTVPKQYSAHLRTHRGTVMLPVDYPDKGLRGNTRVVLNMLGQGGQVLEQFYLWREESKASFLLEEDAHRVAKENALAGVYRVDVVAGKLNSAQHRDLHRRRAAGGSMK